MSRMEIVGRLRAWFAVRARSYGRVVVALCLNVPFLVAALSRYPEGVRWTSFGGIYAGLVFLGYYVLILLLLLTCLFLVAGAWRRIFLGASAAMLTLALYYFVIDAVIYRVLRIHIDAFWLRYVATTYDGLGIGARNVAAATTLLVAIGALEWWLFRVAAGVRARKLWMTALTVVCTGAFVVTQALHVAAYEANDTRITGLTPELPFYYPLASHPYALKYGDRLPVIREGGALSSGEESLRYPLRDVPCKLSAGQRRPNILVLLLESWRADAMDPVITPNMYAFSRHASVFARHFSSGNSTPAGVFGLFYGIHSTYWPAVKANNALIHNPVLIDALAANDYAFGIFADSHFERHKIKDAVFRGIDVHEAFGGSTADSRDRDMTDQLAAFMERQHQAGKPFFGLAFYKSTHYPYDYPPGSAPFQPARELSFLRAAGSDDPTPVLNDYRNSVHWVDELVGRLLRRMQETGLLDSTIVVITGDHGEEFNDNHRNYWGHTGNFTAYQTRVPLVVYIPGRAPRRVTTVTAQVDVVPTLLQEGLGCGRAAEDYSNGLNLFGALEDRRPIVVSSYVNHALIVGDDVFVTWPMYVQRYKLYDISAGAGWPASRLVKQALNEVGRFYGKPAAGTAPVAGAASPTAYRALRRVSSRP